MDFPKTMPKSAEIFNRLANNAKTKALVYTVSIHLNKHTM